MKSPDLVLYVISAVLKLLFMKLIAIHSHRKQGTNAILLSFTLIMLSVGVVHMLKSFTTDVCGPCCTDFVSAPGH